MNPCAEEIFLCATLGTRTKGSAALHEISPYEELSLEEATDLSWGRLQDDEWHAYWEEQIS